MPKHKGETTTAHYTGSILEKLIHDRLVERGYTYVDRARFLPACYLEQPIYSRQFWLGMSVYDEPFKCDFIVYHPKLWPDCLVIEAKWQEAGGSVDEKYPYLVLNLKMKNPYKCMVLLDGEGYKPGAERWLRNQTDGKLLHVFNMREFQTWVNRGGL